MPSTRLRGSSGDIVSTLALRAVSAHAARYAEDKTGLPMGRRIAPDAFGEIEVAKGIVGMR